MIRHSYVLDTHDQGKPRASGDDPKFSYYNYSKVL